MKDEIRALAGRYAAELKRNIDKRLADMEQDGGGKDGATWQVKSVMVIASR